MKKVSFGLPENVIFCKNCVESNQRFMSSVQHLITNKEKKSTVEFDEDGICLACKYAEKKRSVNWKKKETEFLSILELNDIACEFAFKDPTPTELLRRFAVTCDASLFPYHFLLQINLLN